MRLLGLSGLNLWLVLGLLPLGLSHAPLWSYTTLGPAAALLGIGYARRDERLLYGFLPMAALPLGLIEGGWLTAQAAVPPMTLAVALFVAYLYLLGREFRPELAPTGEARSWTADRLPDRWRRRARMYRLAAAYVLILPFALTVAAQLTLEPGQTRLASLVALTILVFVLLVFRSYLMAPLGDHLHQDRATQDALRQSRRRAKQSPRLAFYLAVLGALASLGALLIRSGRLF
jgi:hypothetical protein